MVKDHTRAHGRGPSEGTRGDPEIHHALLRANVLSEKRSIILEDCPMRTKITCIDPTFHNLRPRQNYTYCSCTIGFHRFVFIKIL